jgi:hypothetical protein
MLHYTEFLGTMVALLVPRLVDRLPGKLRTLYDRKGTCERMLTWHDALRQFDETGTGIEGNSNPLCIGRKAGFLPCGCKGSKYVLSSLHALSCCLRSVC